MDRVGRVGVVDAVEQHDLRQVQQRVDGLVVAVRRPDAGQQVGDDERVDDPVQVREVARAALDDDRLAQQPDLRRGSTSDGAAIVATASSVVRSGSTEQTIVRDGW